MKDKKEINLEAEEAIKDYTTERTYINGKLIKEEIRYE